MKIFAEYRSSHWLVYEDGNFLVHYDVFYVDSKYPWKVYEVVGVKSGYISSYYTLESAIECARFRIVTIGKTF